MKNLLPLVYLYLMCLPVLAQTPDGGVINQGADIVISSGTYIYIDGDTKGDYVTSSDGEIDQDGTIILEGDFINNNATSTGFSNLDKTGLTQFIGANNNLIIGGTKETTFENIQINRSAQNINVNQSASVEGVLTLTAGFFTTASGKYMHCLDNVAGAVSGGATTSFVNGELRRNTTTSTVYDFPVGDGLLAKNYHKATVTSGATFTGPSRVDVSVFENTFSGNNTDAQLFSANITELGTQLTSVLQNSDGEYVEWLITPDVALTSGDYNIDLSLNDLTSGLTDNTFTVIKRPDASTDFADFDTFESTTDLPAASTTGRTVAGGVASKGSFDGFSRFTIGRSPFVLPVELVRFQRNCTDESPVLSWTTASETNNSHYIIEHSSDASNFESIGTVFPESPNSNVLNEYTYEIPNKEGYYRLNQVDLNGTQNLSDIIFASTCIIDKNHVQITSFDNQRILLSIQSQFSGAYTYQLFSIEGKQIQNPQSISVQKGLNNIEMPTRGLATGTYLVKLFNEKEVHSKVLFIR